MEELDRHIQSALKKDVNFHLPENFSEKLIHRIIEKAKRERRWEIAGIISAALLLAIAFIVTLYFTNFKFSMGALTFLSEHFGLISFGVLFIALLHLIDKKIIRKHQVG